MGPSVFTGNTAGNVGGAILILRATLNVTGPLCAINNTALGGGFLHLYQASSIIPDQEDASIASTSAGDHI